MGNFFKSLFSSSETKNTVDIQEKNGQKNFDIFKYDGIRAMQMDRVPYAIKCYREALKIREDREVMQFLATAHASLHETGEALEVMHRLVELDPEDLNVRLIRAGLFYQEGKEREAIADCLHVLEKDDSQPAAWFIMGRAKKKQKDLTGAIADLTKAVKLKEDFADARLLRAESLFEANLANEALFDIDKLIETAPEEETVFLLRGRIYEYLGDLDAAADSYNRVVNLNPFNEEASLLKASLLINEGKPEEAIDLLSALIELKPESAQAYRERGKVKLLKGNIKDALEDERKADELEPVDTSEEVLEAKRTNFDDMYKGGIF
jgi:tetratricopeptide (TPR) repeat protein